jgi:O-antigen ligase
MSNITLLLASLLGLSSWLAPNHYVPWLSFHSDALMAAAGLLALIGEIGSDFKTRQLLSPLMLATLALACVPLAQALVGLIRFAGDGWMVFGYLLAFALAQLLGWMLAGRFGIAVLVEGLSGMFIVASLACIGLELYQWLRLVGLGVFAADLQSGHSPYANVAQPNHLASMLFLGLVAVLYLYERQRLSGSVAAVGAIFIEFGMVMTGSRTAWLTVALLSVGVWTLRRRANLRMPRAACVGVFLSFIAILAAWEPLNDIMLLSPGRTLEVQADAGPRPQMWATMLDAISRQPWFGYGWNQGLVAHSRVADAHPLGGRLIENSHNLVLDLMVWNGVPLGLALTGLLLWWFWRQLRAGRSPPQVYLLAAVAGVFVHALLEFPLSYMYFLLPVGMMMGALDSAIPWRRSLSVPRWLIGGAAAIATALLALIIHEYIEIEANMRVLRFEVARIGTATIESKAPELTLLTQVREYLRFARIESHPGMGPDEIAWMGHVVERFPYAPALFSYALANGLNGRTEMATATLAHLCRMHTKRRCDESLRAWKDLARNRYPQLDAVALPAPP